MFFEAGSGFSRSHITGPTSGWTTSGFTELSLIIRIQLHGDITVTNGEVVPIIFLQDLGCGFGSICDFSDTAQMSLTLPSDVTLPPPPASS